MNNVSNGTPPQHWVAPITITASAIAWLGVLIAWPILRDWQPFTAAAIFISALCILFVALHTTLMRPEIFFEDERMTVWKRVLVFVSTPLLAVVLLVLGVSLSWWPKEG